MPADFFVNRDQELQRFLMPSGKPVLVVHGENGVGKSALRRRMEAACETRKVLVEWRRTRAHDQLAIMTAVAEAAVAAFTEFNTLLARFDEADRSITVNLQTSGAIEVARAAQLQNVGTVNATAVNIEQVVTGALSNSLAANRLTRLTDSFLRCLASCGDEAPLVIFLDAFEMAGIGTKEWLWSEFAAAFDEDSLRHIRLVVFTSEKPEIESHVQRHVDLLALEPLSVQHVVDYMQRRGVSLSADQLGLVADGIIAASSGNMIRIVSAVEVMLARQTAAGRK